MGDLTNKYQLLTLNLEDGRMIEATVPAFCDPADGVMPAIIKIDITEPIVIPDGMRFMKLPLMAGAGDDDKRTIRRLADDSEIAAIPANE